MIYVRRNALPEILKWRDIRCGFNDKNINEPHNNWVLKFNKWMEHIDSRFNPLKKQKKTGLFITQILYLLSLSSSNMTFSLFSNKALSFLFCEATTICIESNINVWQHLVDALKKPQCPIYYCQR